MQKHTSINRTNAPIEQSSWPTIIWSAALFLGLFIFLAGSVQAQLGGSGSINGSVTDSSGAVVAGATVTATSTATNVTVTQNTSGSGTYVLSLAPGDYTVTITAKGFKTYTQEH